MINRVVISHLFSTSGQCSLVTKAECARTHGRNPKLPQVVTCKSRRQRAQQASRLTSAIHASTEVPPGTIRRVTLPERRYFVLIDPSARSTCCDDIWSSDHMSLLAGTSQSLVPPDCGLVHNLHYPGYENPGRSARAPAGRPGPPRRRVEPIREGGPMSIARPPPRWGSAMPLRTWSKRVRVRARAAVRRLRRTRLGRLDWPGGLVRLLLCTTAFAVVLAAAGFYHVYLDRNSLPDLEGFTRFEFPTIGHIYDAHDQPLKEMAAESRQITRYEEIPLIVRDAILAAEDKNFFSHSGVDYSGFARVLCKIRLGNLIRRLSRMGSRDAANNSAIFPQGGSTITQQLVRGYFLKTVTAQENSGQLRYGGRMASVL